MIFHDRSKSTLEAHSMLEFSQSQVSEDQESQANQQDMGYPSDLCFKPGPGGSVAVDSRPLTRSNFKKACCGGWSCVGMGKHLPEGKSM